jgi:hypothetical protein
MNQELINIIKRQKTRKDAFLPSDFVLRDQLKEKEELLKPGLIKIITGPRRAGKSTFLFLLLQGIDFMYANFDDEELLQNISNKNEFTDALEEVYGKTNAILFDEIQNLPSWDLYLNKLQREGYNVFITGSNSNLLSTEFASSLTGRYRTLEILPFNYSEYTKFNNQTDLLSKFLKQGGFPEVVVKDVDLVSYIDNLVSSILYKDITRRYRVKDPEKIELMIAYLIANTCNIVNYKKMGETCELTSFRTLKRYLSYIQNCYLFYLLSGFSFKTSNHLKSAKKLYVVDNGILSYKNLFNSPSNGLFFENLVFTELTKQGYAPNSYLFYYKTKNNKEIDFVLKDIHKIHQLIQVCFDISSKRTEEREINALLQASNELSCDNLLIITPDTDRIEKINGKIVNIVSFRNWLLK